MSLRKYTVLSITLFLLTFIVTAVLRSQSTSNAIARQQQASENNQSDDYYPIAEYSANLPTDPEKRAKRELRNKRGNLRDKNLKPEDVEGFSIASRFSKAAKPKQSNNKQVEEGQSTPPQFNNSKKYEDVPLVAGAAVSDHTPPEQPLPTGSSDAIIIGEVIDTKAFVSEDKTSVYSEFQTRIDEILKNSDTAPLTPGESIDVLRPGGGVRLPSGEVPLLYVEGRGYPRTGRRYVLFLKYDQLSQSYYIATGYELRDGKVFPLDGIPKYGSENHPFATYSKYKEVKENQFFIDLRQAITNPPPPLLGGYAVGPPPSKEDEQ